jgi:type VI protein secretion system component VasF
LYNYEQSAGQGVENGRRHRWSRVAVSVFILVFVLQKMLALIIIGEVKTVKGMSK